MSEITTHETRDHPSDAVRFASRIVHGATALAGTLLVATAIGLEAEQAREVAILTAGLGFYTDLATDRVTDAIDRAVRKVRRA